MKKDTSVELSDGYFDETLEYYHDSSIISGKKEYNNYHPMIKNELIEMDGRLYLEYIKKKHNAVSINEKIVSGMPTVKGTRIQISLIVACLRDEMSIEEICEDYHLTPDMVTKAMDFVIDILDHPFLGD